MEDKTTYYSSHSKLPFIGKQGQDKLEQSRVLVIGAGGLGCPCLLALAGAGIGIIGIADFDKVAVSNLHRQQLYTINDAGKLKTMVAAEKLQQYNPFVSINRHEIFVEESNILSLIAAYGIIVDCTDNFATRYLINDACVYLNKPLVYGAIHHGEGHVTIFNYNNSPTLRCLFSKEENESIASCAEIGAYNITTIIIGNMMANEVIKIITGHPDVLAGKFKQLNILDGTAITIAYENSVDGRTKSLERFNKETASTEITVKAASKKFNQQQAVFLIDVRELDEHRKKNIGGSNIPLQTFLQTTAFPFLTTDEIIVYCQKGNRSRLAVNYLVQKGFTNAKSLQGGIEQYWLLSAE